MIMLGTPGLSPQEFAGRLLDAPHIANDWPFSYMPSDTFYTDRKAPDRLDWASKPGDALVLAEVWGTYPGAVSFRTHAPGVKQDSPAEPYGIFADVEAGTEKAWAQMTGVKLALSVTIEESPRPGLMTLDGTLNRILGIAQPLRTPDSNGRHSVKSGDREKGYIHGTVLEDTKPSHYYRTALLLGRETAKTHLTCNYAQTRAVHGAEHHDSPQAGDIIRVRATRLRISPQIIGPQNYKQEGAVLHILGQTS